jgi:hypothetical protein
MKRLRALAGFVLIAALGMAGCITVQTKGETQGQGQSATVSSTNQKQAERTSKQKTAPRAKGAVDGKWKGKTPDLVRDFETLHGIKEGKGATANTVYIFVDPRCGFCRRVYNESRAYINKGHSIKWIPVVVLGDPDNGNALAAAMLNANSPAIVRRIIGNKEQIKVKPTATHRQKLEYNEAYFFAAFRQADLSGQEGVPMALYLDHRTGKVTIMTRVYLPELFGSL